MKKLLMVQVDCGDDFCEKCQFSGEHNELTAYCCLYEETVIENRRTLTCLQCDVDRKLMRWTADDIKRATDKAKELAEFFEDK